MQILELYRSCKLKKEIKINLIKKTFLLSQEDIIKRADLDLCPKKLKKFYEIEKKILEGEAPQYALKQANFFGRDFKINKNVLIPCFETEFLVEKAINFLARKKSKDIKILDIGTGSGIIPITIVKELKNKNISVIACDISTSALNVAKINDRKFKTMINFQKSDLFENIEGKYDLITANLPYGAQNDVDFIDNPNPKIAVIGGRNGFEIIARCLFDLEKFLKKDGLALFEIGHDQKKAVREILKEIPALKFKIHKDLNGFDRIVEISSRTRPA